jgi:hypothetical protein
MLSCGHDQRAFGSPLCPHLRACREPWIEYVRWYTGQGMASDLICKPCAEQRKKGESTDIEMVCEECFTYATREVGDLTSVGGTPEIRERGEPFHGDIRETVIPPALGPLLDIAPVTDHKSTWLLLGEDGWITRLDVGTGEYKRAARVAFRNEPDHEPWNGRILKRKLHASADGAFAAVVNDYGRYGQVFDLKTGGATVDLDGGEYYQETVPFTFSFVRFRGRSAVIHRTDWNRLDITDVTNGEKLTERAPTSYQRDEPRPAHYLDYFHGRLHISPSGRSIVDDGWVWHPYGVVTQWTLDAWETNVWESEDGSSKTDFCARAYYWDHAMTWITDGLVAVGGIGNDDIAMTDGARLFDVTLPGGERTSFPGPKGTFFSDGTSLFSSDETGLSRWDITDGARTGRLPGFNPSHYHAGSGELAQLIGQKLLRYAVKPEGALKQ